MIELWRGNANAWECDELGHLNVRGYLAKSLQALDVLGAHMGVQNPCAPNTPSMLIPHAAHVRFTAEARPGAPLSIEGGVVSTTDAALTAAFVIRHANGQTAAGVSVAVNHVTRRDLAPFAWPARMRDRAEALTISEPKECQPRTFTHAPPVVTCDELEKMGLRIIGRGVFTVAETAGRDVIGPDVYFARASDSFQHVIADAADLLSADHVNVAMVEARLTKFTHARAGDPFEIHTGVARVQGKQAMIIHHFINPFTGDVWGRLETIGLFFDLKARKAVAPAREVVSALSPVITPQLLGD